MILSQKVCAGRIRTNAPTPGYNIQSLFRILPQHTVALRCAKSLELPQNGFLRGNQYSENETERFCDDIAGEYLLPSADLERLSNGYDPDALTISDQIGLLANELNVSRTMVAYRAYRSSVIKQDTYARLSAIYRQQWRDELERRRSQAQAREGGPNYYTIRRHRLGNRMINLVRRMMAADALSTSKAARILGLKSRQVQSLLGARRSS